MRHFLGIDDLGPSELARILNLATTPNPPPVLAGKGASLLFEKPSARTRSATEMAVVQLGGHPTYIGAAEVGLDERESVEDVTRTLACYSAVIGARVFAHDTVKRMASVSAVPVINLLSDVAHPTQAVADLLTIREARGHLEGRAPMVGRVIAHGIGERGVGEPEPPRQIVHLRDRVRLAADAVHANSRSFSSLSGVATRVIARTLAYDSRPP